MREKQKVMGDGINTEDIHNTKCGFALLTSVPGHFLTPQ